MCILYMSESQNYTQRENIELINNIINKLQTSNFFVHLGF